MLPVQLDVARLKLAVVGRGAEAARKLKFCDGAGARFVTVYSDQPGDALAAIAGDRLVERLPHNRDLAEADIVFVAGLNDTLAGEIATACRALKVLVNVEDRKQFCDFHLPALVRRGDLTLTISTSGRAPGLAGSLRRYVERLFGPEWAGHIEELAAARDGWRADGADMAAVKRRIDRYIDEQGWLG
jgi:precorrin-2 dehydrogenase